MGKKLIRSCKKCRVEMIDSEVGFRYLNRSFRHKVPRCPKCGQVYISEELAAGRIQEVEKILEDK